MKRLLLFIVGLLVGVSFFAAPVSAQISGKCFTETMCTDAKGIFQKNPGCPGNLGLCVAKQPDVALNLAIGGKTTVAGIADYLVTAYNYFVGIGVVSAIILMMVGGLRWTSSAGSSERIGAAKKMISNALSGLVLLLGSYLILFTINPDLIKLKAPQVPMIRKESIASNASCQLQSSFMIAPVGDKPFEELEATAFINQGPAAPFMVPECGKKYYMKDAGGITCSGYVCKQAGFSCNDGKCEKSILAGTVQSDDIQPPIIDNNMELAVLCESGVIHTIKSLDVTKLATTMNGYTTNKWTYSFAGLTEQDITDGVEKCGQSSDGSRFLYRGFFIDAEVNDSGLVGGEDDFYGVGRDIPSARTGACKLSVNLCKHTKGCDPLKDEFNDGDSDTFGENAVEIGRRVGHDKPGEKFSDEDYANVKLNPGGKAAGCSSPLCMYLIPREWLNGKSSCDILINRSEFPAL